MKLQEGKPFIVADGEEYLEAEPIETSGGEAAVMSDQNVSEKEKNQDALGIAMINGFLVAAVADGISGLADSETIASAWVRESLSVAEEMFRKKGRINPGTVDRVSAKRLLQKQREKPNDIKGGTVGSFVVIDPNGLVNVHRFGDPEFARSRWKGTEVHFTLGVTINLLPQNVALEDFLAGRLDDIKSVLRPTCREQRVVTHCLRVDRVSNPLMKPGTRFRLRHGEWFIVGTDGIRLYRAPSQYADWFHKHPKGRPDELAHFASCMVLDGHDNGSGFFYRHGV